jgi:ABC-type bacteriocin/lantibiotic exporter with double-glycine peptidase domain
MFHRVAKTLLAWSCLCSLLAASAPPGIWLDVPFVRQEKEGCGAASIAMIMQYWARQQGRTPDQAASAAQIQRTLYSPEGRGIFASDAERYFRQQGFRTFSFRGEWPDLKQHLEKGRPLMVALQPSAHAPLHYVVVTGLDWEHKIVLVNDPAQRKLLKQDQASFEREWNATGNWTLLALPQAEAH